jgi:hypothetical protein
VSSEQTRAPREATGTRESEDSKAKRQERNEQRRDRGGHIGSGDAREQADQEEFDRGGIRVGQNRSHTP